MAFGAIPLDGADRSRMTRVLVSNCDLRANKPCEVRDNFVRYSAGVPADPRGIERHSTIIATRLCDGRRRCSRAIGWSRRLEAADRWLPPRVAGGGDWDSSRNVSFL